MHRSHEALGELRAHQLLESHGPLAVCTSGAHQTERRFSLSIGGPIDTALVERMETKEKIITTVPTPIAKAA